jgi:hypothetical protein
VSKVTVQELIDLLAEQDPDAKVMVSVDGGPDHDIIDDVERNEHGVWIIVQPEGFGWTL